MANITKTNTRKNVVELRKTLMNDGTTMETVYVNDRPFCCMGSVSKEDREAGLKVIQTAIDGSDTPCEAQLKLLQIALISDTGANPTEQITVCDEELCIDYKQKTAYNLAGDAVIDCKDVDCNEEAAIREILKSRYEAKVRTEEVKSWEESYIAKIMGE